MNIIIRDILAKYMTQKGDTHEENLAAIKEIVEAVVDKCAEEAKTKPASWAETKEEDVIVDKNSIYNVKNMIDYE